MSSRSVKTMVPAGFGAIRPGRPGRLGGGRGPRILAPAQGRPRSIAGPGRVDQPFDAGRTAWAAAASTPPAVPAMPGTEAPVTAVPVAIARSAATRAAAGGAGRRGVGGQFRQAGDLAGAAGEQRDEGECGGQAAGGGGEQVVAAGQVRALVREDRRELWLVQDAERAAGDHDRRRAARHAVRGRARVVEHDRAGARQGAAGQQRAPRVPSGSSSPPAGSAGRNATAPPGP